MSPFGQQKWGVVAVSIIITLTFTAVLIAWIFYPVIPENEKILTMLLGVLTAKFGDVAGYWINSSAGSKAKDEMLLKATPPKEPIV